MSELFHYYIAEFFSNSTFFLFATSRSSHNKTVSSQWAKIAKSMTSEPPGGGGGGTPICGLYRYVPRDRVCFLRFSVLK